jgi:hypothetical protein
MNAAEVFNRITQELEGHFKTDGTYQCRCPCPDHEDKNPSCNIKLSGDNILAYCFVCGKGVAGAALKARGLWPDQKDTSTYIPTPKPRRTNPQPQTLPEKLPPGIPKEKEGRSFAGIWTYKDKNGKILGYTVRYDDSKGKTIVPYCRQNQQGNWWNKFPENPRPLYGLNLLHKAPKDLMIWLVEGEKCAEALRSLPPGSRRLAVTFMGGSSGIGNTDWSPLAGRKIRIWPDNDKPGQEYVGRIRIQLEALMPPPTIEIIDVSKLGLEETGDVFDWLQIHEPDELSEIPLISSHVDVSEPDFKILPKPEIEMHRIHGFASRFVKLATADSEADPAAILLTFLVRFGVEIGRDPCFHISDTVHHGQLAAVIVGDSALSRKGTSAKPIQKLFDYENLYGPDTLKFKPARHSSGPFSSGEGIIYAVRDPVLSWCKKGKDKNTTVIEDPGEKDKRLFVLDEEFAGVLANTKREGNTLSTVIRVAWDSGNFDPLTKNKKIKATGAHVGWVSHITNQELNEKMTKCEAFNGFANRILWIFSSRRGSLPNPRPMPEDKLKAMKDELIEILSFCRDLEYGNEITLSPGALAAWENMYDTKLMKKEPGLLGILAARGSAQVRRLAMLFALLDKQIIISAEHLNQAVTIWEYSAESAKYIFDATYINPDQKKICEALKEKGELTKTEISNLFGRHYSANKTGKLLSGMLNNGMIKIEKRKMETGKPITYISFRKS